MANLDTSTLRYPIGSCRSKKLGATALCIVQRCDNTAAMSAWTEKESTTDTGITTGSALPTELQSLRLFLLQGVYIGVASRNMTIGKRRLRPQRK